MQHNGVVCFQHLQEETNVSFTLMIYRDSVIRIEYDKLHNIAVIRECVYIR